MKNVLPKDITIVIVNDFDYVQGGASKVALDTAKILYENGYQVIFFSGSHQDNEYTSIGFKNISLNISECLKDKNKIRGSLRGIYNLKARKEFKRLLSNLDPNKTIIHIHGWTKTLSSSIFNVAFKMRFKVVLTLHDYFSACPNGGFFNYKKNKICKLAPLSCKCIFTNCDSRNYFFKVYRILRHFVQNKIVKLNEKIEFVIYVSNFSHKILNKYFSKKTSSYIIYNPLDEFKKQINSKQVSKKYILFVGRVSKEKGIILFCKAVSELNYPAIVIGDGPLLNVLKKEFPNIKFLGWKNSKEIINYYQYAHVFVFPSLWYETAGLTVLEAAQCNLYSLVSDNSASKEFVKKYSIGDLFQSGNLNDLKDKLQNLFSKKKKSITKSIKKINEELNENKYLSNLLNVYQLVLEKGEK